MENSGNLNNFGKKREKRGKFKNQIRSSQKKENKTTKKWLSDVVLCFKFQNTQGN